MIGKTKSCEQWDHRAEYLNYTIKCKTAKEAMACVERRQSYDYHLMPDEEIKKFVKTFNKNRCKSTKTTIETMMAKKYASIEQLMKAEEKLEKIKSAVLLI